MSQDALLVPNGSGIAVRTGFNAALARLATKASGNGRPADIAVFEDWIETDNPGSGIVSWWFYDGSADILIATIDVVFHTVDFNVAGETGGGGVPVGTVASYAGTSAPAGWLLCAGQSLLRATYPALFAVIGTTYGSADGTHFSLPDCRGRAVFGRDNMSGDANRITSAGSGIDGNVLGASGGSETKNIVINDPLVFGFESGAGGGLTDVTADPIAIIPPAIILNVIIKA